MNRIAAAAKPPAQDRISRAYVCLLIVWRVLSQAGLGHHWPLMLLDLLAIWLYLPGLLLILVACLRRDWRTVTWLSAAGLLFLEDFGTLFVPKAVRGSGYQIRVMTINLMYANRDSEAVSSTLVGQNPDVIAMQELGIAMAGSLSASLQRSYPYQSLHPHEGSLGLGVFSRYPIRSDQLLAIGREGCRQLITIDVSGRQVSIWNVHLGVPSIQFTRLWLLPVPTNIDTTANEQAVLSLIEQAKSVNEPLVIVGDLNLSDRQPAYRTLVDRFGDAFREAGLGLGYTFPSTGLDYLPSGYKVDRLPYFPLVRLDYVLHDERWTARNAWTFSVPGSDHKAVVTDLIGPQ